MHLSHLSSQIGVRVEFSLVGGAGAVESLPREVRVVGVCWRMRCLVMVVVRVLGVLLEQSQGGVGAALPALHLVHGLGHGGERGGGGVGVEVRGGAEDGGVLVEAVRGVGGGRGRGIRVLPFQRSVVVVVVVVGGGQDRLLHLAQIEGLRSAGRSSLVSVGGRV